MSIETSSHKLKSINDYLKLVDQRICKDTPNYLFDITDDIIS